MTPRGGALETSHRGKLYLFDSHNAVAVHLHLFERLWYVALNRWQYHNGNLGITSFDLISSYIAPNPACELLHVMRHQIFGHCHRPSYLPIPVRQGTSRTPAVLTGHMSIKRSCLLCCIVLRHQQFHANQEGKCAPFLARNRSSLQSWLSRGARMRTTYQTASARYATRLGTEKAPANEICAQCDHLLEIRWTP